jgi:hypothetical protein
VDKVGDGSKAPTHITAERRTSYHKSVAKETVAASRGEIVIPSSQSGRAERISMELSAQCAPLITESLDCQRAMRASLLECPDKDQEGRLLDFVVLPTLSI